MPVKKRKSKMRAHLFTPEVFAAFDAGDKYALRRALKLPPWHASPLDTDLADRLHMVPRHAGHCRGPTLWRFGGRYSRC